MVLQSAYSSGSYSKIYTHRKVPISINFYKRKLNRAVSEKEFHRYHKNVPGTFANDLFW